MTEDITSCDDWSCWSNNMSYTYTYTPLHYTPLYSYNEEDTRRCAIDLQSVAYVWSRISHGFNAYRN